MPLVVKEWENLKGELRRVAKSSEKALEKNENPLITDFSLRRQTPFHNQIIPYLQNTATSNYQSKSSTQPQHTIKRAQRFGLHRLQTRDSHSLNVWL